MTITEKLFSLRDEKYASFGSSLIPGFADDYFIGVRSPQLRAIAKELGPTDFLDQLPHRYHDENMLHAYVLCNIKDYRDAMRLTEQFLPYVNNWAVCDSLAPKAFARHTDELLPHVRKWIDSQQTYTVRFAIGCLMRWYLDDTFRAEYLEWVASVASDEYYVKMMQAWYFATALAKQWEATILYIEQRRLQEWVHRKTIQKAIESYRVTDEQKQQLRLLRGLEKEG